jgi:hypothetical protein
LPRPRPLPSPARRKSRSPSIRYLCAHADVARGEFVRGDADFFASSGEGRQHFVDGSAKFSGEEHAACVPEPRFVLARALIGRERVSIEQSFPHRFGGGGEFLERRAVGCRWQFREAIALRDAGDRVGQRAVFAVHNPRTDEGEQGGRDQSRHDAEIKRRVSGQRSCEEHRKRDAKGRQFRAGRLRHRHSPANLVESTGSIRRAGPVLLKTIF